MVVWRKQSWLAHFWLRSVAQKRCVPKLPIIGQRRRGHAREGSNVTYVLSFYWLIWLKCLKYLYRFILIDLFSLHVLFSHFGPRDATRGNSFFQMSSYARANVRITNEKNKRKIPMRASRSLKWENKMYKLKRSIELHENQHKGPVHTKTIVNANDSKRKLFDAFRPSVHTKTMKTLTVNA